MLQPMGFQLSDIDRAFEKYDIRPRLYDMKAITTIIVGLQNETEQKQQELPKIECVDISVLEFTI